MTEWGSSAALAGLVVEAVEWLPSGADSGLVRVRGRWTDPSRRESELPALGLRRGDEARRFDSLPDARFGRDPAVWRGTYLVPSALMDPAPDDLWLSWGSGARAALPGPVRGFEPPSTPSTPAPPPEPEGEVIDRAVLAERRARRAEAAERAQAERAAEALKAVEVLELRGAELERRLESLQAEPAPSVELAAPPAEPVTPAPLVREDPAAGALADAIAAIKRLRHELADQRHRLRKSELLRAADAVALASFREEKGRARRLQAELAIRERELAGALAAAEASEAEAAAAREQAAEQVALAARRAAADAAAVRERAASARAELEATSRQLGAERDGHAATREELAERSRELSAIGDELARVRTELATVRRDAEQRATRLERRLVELETALEAERRAHGATASERETARAGLALSESARSAEAVARAALDEELDRERAARATLTAALDGARTELTAALTTQSDLVLSREQARAEAATIRSELSTARDRAASAEASLRAELAAAGEQAASAEATARDGVAAAEERARSAEAARDAAASSDASTRAELAASLERAASAEAAAASLTAELQAARGELGSARERIAELERELETRRDALDSAERDAGGLLGRIAELERAADDDLARRAQEQAAASSAVDRPEGEDRSEVAANIDAAAAALRARPAVEETAKPAPAAEPDAPASVAASAAPAPAAEPQPAAVEAPPAAAPSPQRPRPTIVTEAKHPPRADVAGSSKRRYPWLRGVLVKLAHDDPRAATRLVLGLVPVQRALVSPPLEYDLTIRDSGTYAISIGEQGATARSVGGPRPREEAAFHASADIVTLAELLAGVDKRMGRWLGSVRVHGRRRSAEALRAALSRADLDLAAAARAGADLDPDLVFRAFAYAIHPSWTKGHAFTVAQELAGPQPLRWHVAVRDGKPITVERRAPARPPDAVVSMTRDAFSHLLRGENPPRGERPAIRGDRAAVALLKGWTDRAQGR
jgi:hypothetical protein